MIHTDATHNVMVGEKCYRHLRGRWAVFHSSRIPSWSEKDASALRRMWDRTALEVRMDGDPEVLTGWFLLNDYENRKIDMVLMVADQMGMKLDVVDPRAHTLTSSTPTHCTAEILKAAASYAQNPDLSIDFEMRRLELLWGPDAVRAAMAAGHRLRELGLRSE